MERRLRLALWIAVLPLCLFPATFAEEEVLQTDLHEKSLSRLYVVPLRIEARNVEKSDACLETSVDQLAVRLRGKTLKRKVAQRHVSLDRRLRPMLHALVFDTSGSMSLDLIDAKRAAHAYVEQLDATIETGMIVGFDDGVTLWNGVTPERDKLHRSIDRVGVGGQTSLFDALVSTIRELDAHRERPVIILLSDGADNASFYDAKDVLDELSARPDIAVFTIGIGRRSIATRQLLTELARSTHGKYFEVERGAQLDSVFAEIREILGTEALLTVSDPLPDAEPGEIEVEGRGPCRVTVLGSWSQAQERRATHEPIDLPTPNLPLTFESSVSGAHDKVLAASDFSRKKNRCLQGSVLAEVQRRSCSFEVQDDRLLGCAPDITMDHGYLYNPNAPLLIEKNEAVSAELRPFEIATPPIDELPHRAEALIDVLLRHLPEDPPGPEFDLLDREELGRRLFGVPNLVSGATFLEMRPRIARAFFMHPEYQSWALRRLKERADESLELLGERYRRQFPQASEEAIQLAVSQSDDARAIRARAERPSEIDLQPLLSAWLGDIPAQQLFRSWEIESTQRWLDGEEDPAMLERWHRLRRVLATPSIARAIAPMVPVYDDGCDCIGFYRILLPRPALLRARLSERTPFQGKIPLDLPPKFPFGYAVVRQTFEESPEFTALIEAGGYAVEDISYELLGPAAGHDPRHAFRETRVRVLWSNEAGESLTLEADLHASIPPPRPARNGKPPRPRRARWILDRVEVPEGRRSLNSALERELAGIEILRPDQASLRAERR